MNNKVRFRMIDGNKFLEHIPTGIVARVRNSIPPLSDLVEDVRGFREARKNVTPITRRDANGNRIYGLLAGVHVEPNQVYNVWFQRKLAVVNADKSPRSKGNHTGIELELRSSLGRTEITKLVLEAGLEKHVNVASDGSIRVDGGTSGCASCNGECDCPSDEGGDVEHDCECTCTNTSGPYTHGHELRVIAVNSKIKDVVTRLTKVLNTKGDVDINDSCGMHVHLDMRNRDPKIVYHNLQQFQKLLYAMCPIRRKENDYCKPIRGYITFEENARLDRYLGINKLSYKKHKTLEVRIHSGTTNRDKILNWTELLNAIADLADPVEAPNSLDETKALLGLDDATMSYIESRLKKFDGDHKSGYVSNDVNPAAIPDLFNQSRLEAALDSVRYASGDFMDMVMCDNQPVLFPAETTTLPDEAESA